MEEKELYEALGVNPEGANEQETAEPAGARSGAGANEQEPAEPAEPDGAGSQGTPPAASGGEMPDGAEPEEASAPETEEDKQSAPQDKEKRRRMAAARRERELRDAQERARTELRKELDERIAKAFRSAGLKNPMRDNAPITSLEELEAYQQAWSREQTDRDLQSGNVTRETIQQVMEQTPQMQAVRELQQQAQQDAEQARRARDEQLLDEQIAELQKLDPRISGRQELADALQDGEQGEQMQRLVRQGLSFVEAWKLTHIDELTARAAAQERARTEKNIRGKEHLKATNAQGKGARAVPAGQMELFRMMCPNLSDRQIEEWYAKTYKE